MKLAIVVLLLVVLYAQAQETSVNDMLHESGFELQMMVRLGAHASLTNFNESFFFLQQGCTEEERHAVAHKMMRLQYLLNVRALVAI